MKSTQFVVSGFRQFKLICAAHEYPHQLNCFCVPTYVDKNATTDAKTWNDILTCFSYEFTLHFLQSVHAIS